MPHGPALRWSAYEHEHIERGPDWFWALGVAALALALTAILFGDPLFAIIIVIAAGMLALIARTPPQLAQFEISDRGIRVNDHLYRFDHIIGFWVEDELNDERPLLLVDTTKLLSPNLIIPIEEIHPGLIREFLKEHCPEQPMKEPIGHKILERLGL